MRKIFLVFLIIFIGCSANTIPSPPKFEPTKAEDVRGECLNPCQRGKYYRLLQARKEMQYYVEVMDNSEAIKEASRNIYLIDQEIDEMLDKCKKGK